MKAAEFKKKQYTENLMFEKVIPVDGGNPAPVEVGSLSHYLQGFIHPRWCRISAINSPNPNKDLR